MVTAILPERDVQLKPPLSKDFAQRLPRILQELESEWRVTQQKGEAAAMESPGQSLLRVAHHSLSALLELQSIDPRVWRI